MARLLVISLMAMTGTGSVIPVLKQTGQAVPGRHVAILILSIATSVFSVAAALPATLPAATSESLVYHIRYLSTPSRLFCVRSHKTSH